MGAVNGLGARAGEVEPVREVDEEAAEGIVGMLERVEIEVGMRGLRMG